MSKLIRAMVFGLLGASIALPALAEDLTFWNWRPEDTAAYQKFFADFHAQNPDINIKFQGYEPSSYATVLSTALSGGQGPDLMMVRAYGAFEAMAAPGYLMDLTGKVPALENFPKTAVAAETLRSDGKVYAVPYASQTIFVMYNKDVFDKFGLSEPKTWDELLADAKTLKDNGIIPFANGTATAWQNETLTFGLGSSIMGKGFYDDFMAGKATFEDPRFVEALKSLTEVKDYLPDGFTGLDYPSSQQLFTSGMAGMFVGGSFEIAGFQKAAPDMHIGVFAAPAKAAGDPALVSVFYDGGFAANAKTEHSAAAVKFLNWVASKEFGQEFANDLGNVSVVPGVEFKSPLLGEVASLNQQSIPYMMLVYFRYQEPSGSVLLQQQVQKMMAGETTPEEAAAEITKGIATYYKPFQK
ncbi:MAG TPA: extracellular solute-binding protein [Devosiaceae bacterium]